ncbi:WD40 repeat-like protein [Ramicandelaber brevisporus]|nr:WD40 repeat-like protein [Ramicandelaber brevisporus]
MMRRMRISSSLKYICLEVDNSAYVMLHSMGMEWPALSFDFIKDKLGDNRTAYPATMYLATGSQADRPSNNEITIMKISQLCRTNKDDQVLSDNEDNEDEEEIDEDPALESRSIKHHGGVNRIRISQMNNSASAIAATWSDTGKVHLFDIQHHLNSLDTHGTVIPMSARKPIYTVEGHRGIEGYSLDFSSKTGSLLSGDCNGKIILTTRNLNTGNFVSDDNKVFKGHEGSVEDLQWSPSENTVFASCSSDKTIRIWDTRSNSRTPQLSILAHNDDVNVISWNNSSSHLIVSGCQDGSFNIWDIRTFISNKNITSNGLVQPMAMASFKWHTSPITSIEWHPIEESVIAVSGADDQLTLWDLSVEHDAEEAKRDPTMSTITGRGKDDATLEVPPQLLFIHQGQKDIKELHWHPQLPGTIVSTAFDGLNIFKTISI